jgi:hypothetical protein
MVPKIISLLNILEEVLLEMLSLVKINKININMPSKLLKKGKLKNSMFCKMKKLRKLVPIFFLHPFVKPFKMIAKYILLWNTCQKAIFITTFVGNNAYSQNKLSKCYYQKLLLVSKSSMNKASFTDN